MPRRNRIARPDRAFRWRVAERVQTNFAARAERQPGVVIQRDADAAVVARAQGVRLEDGLTDRRRKSLPGPRR